ncbi:peptidoglycan D,D-transpeptidase FtsI family protein [Leptolyngbya sp. KIOST-1]|uniref:peptidoglycan D,D-transpeptidase FtsI family protein n=1 Tax=Leptolyngbya sp. KIOST-1 TaxID=1229172 RepID=UPI000563CA6B|nr:penicillin-binding protein 2 [Leptolyngbya sp. KIOST-1]
MASSTYSARRRRRQRPRPRAVVAMKPATNQRRVLLVWGLLVLAMVAIAGRLAWLQLSQGDSLASLAQQQRFLPSIQRQLRHSIVDRQGNVLAVDQVVYTLYVHPRLFSLSPQEVAAGLSPLLEMPQAELLERFSRQPTGIRLVDGLSEASVDRIRALRLNGIELHAQQQRFYPQQHLFAPLVGFVNFDGQPQAGLEMAYQEQLTLVPPEPPENAAEDNLEAQDGAQDGAVAAVDPALLYGPPEPGEAAADSAGVAGLAAPADSEPLPPWQTGRVSLQLTLDSRLQRAAQQELEATVQQFRAKRGTVMVIDAPTGEVLALASVPTYDPNEYYRADLNHLRTWAISDLYEPGSTFKQINIAIALEAGLIGPDELVNDSGQMQIGRWTIRNHDFATTGGRGPISITDVLKYSSNVGMMRIMQKMPAADYFAWLQRLTLDGPSGIDLPAEASGQMKDREQFVRSLVEPATTAFGQGFSLSPIKMLQLQATLANGGKLITPHLVKGLVNEAGESVWTPTFPEPVSLFSPQTTQQVLTMMEAVVDSGTGSAAKIPGYRVGGKTGTAQKAVAGGYGRGRITSFVAILPIDNPRYVVQAIVDEPQGADAYGSTVAAPLVKKVTEALVVLEGLPPSGG